MHVQAPELGCTFRRDLSIDGRGGLRFNYTIENNHTEPLKFIYCAHPLLNGTPTTRLVIPECNADGYLESALNFEKLRGRGLRSWPALANAITGPYSAERNRCIKCYAAHVAQGHCALEIPEAGEQLAIEFSTESLPHLGILTFEGYGPQDGAPYRSSLFFALEPGTSLGDDFGGATATATLADLGPGQRFQFWIRFSVETHHALRARPVARDGESRG